MSLSVFNYCICTFLCRSRNFNLSLCCLSPFLLSYVTVSRSCCWLEFFPKQGLLNVPRVGGRVVVTGRILLLYPSCIRLPFCLLNGSWL